MDSNKKNVKQAGWSHRTTTRQDVERAIAARLNRPLSDVSDVLCEALNEVADALARGQRVEFRRFGRWVPKRTTARRMQNIHTGKEIEIPARTSVSFKPGTALAELIREESSDEGTAA